MNMNHSVPSSLAEPDASRNRVVQPRLIETFGYLTTITTTRVMFSLGASAEHDLMSELQQANSMVAKSKEL